MVNLDDLDRENSALRARLRTSENREAAKDARIAEIEEALREIGAYGDLRAEDHLGRTGSYSMFDEPAAVERARAALTGEHHDTDK